MTSSKLLVIVLAVVDLVTCAFLIPMELADMLTGFHPGGPYFNKEAYCKACAFFSICILCVKFHIVLLISVERYIMICHPFRSKTLLVLPKVSKAITMIMVVALGMPLPLPILFITKAAFKISGTEVAICAWDYKSDGIILVSWQVYYMIMFILYNLIPLIITTCAYSFVFNSLYKGRSLRADPTTEYAKLRITLAKLVLSISILFAVLNIPHFLLFLSLSFGVFPPDNMLLAVMIVNYSLVLNSIVNPFLYCSHTKSFFRTHIAALFRPERHGRDKNKENYQTTHYETFQITQWILRRYSVATG